MKKLEKSLSKVRKGSFLIIHLICIYVSLCYLAHVGEILVNISKSYNHLISPWIGAPIFFYFLNGLYNTFAIKSWNPISSGFMILKIISGYYICRSIYIAFRMVDVGAIR